MKTAGVQVLFVDASPEWTIRVTRSEGGYFGIFERGALTAILGPYSLYELALAEARHWRDQYMRPLESLGLVEEVSHAAR